MADEALLELAADIVSAHVSNNSVSADELPRLIASVYGSLARLGQPPEPTEEKRVPAVPVRSSVKPDTIACLECGAKMKLLKRHLQTEHSLSPDEYRSRWSLGADYPMIAPQFAAQRKELAHKIGLGRKPGSKAAPAKSAPAPKAAAPKAETPKADAPKAETAKPAAAKPAAKSAKASEEKTSAKPKQPRRKAKAAPES